MSKISKSLDAAKSYSDWRAAAEAYDKKHRLDKWRAYPKSSLYDSIEIQRRHELLKELIDANKSRELLYALNEGMHGNMGGMGRSSLYERALSGTKHLIGDYIDALVDALYLIADTPESIISLVEKVDFFRRASHCYGRTGLMLSGTVGLVYVHHGVMQALMDEKLMPRILSGSSGGSWLCAQAGTLTDQELADGYFEKFRYNMPMDIHPLRVIAGMEKGTTPLTVKEGMLDTFANDMTFQEAFEHTGRYINVSIAPAEKHQASRLLNAITSPNIYIRSAIDASSSVPGLLPPVKLWAKGSDGKPKPYLSTRRWVDGSFAEDLPAKRLARLFGVNHFIVSMNNPVAVPFVRDTPGNKAKTSRKISAELAKSVALNTLETLEKYGSKAGLSFVSPVILMAHALLNQEYQGDINIILSKKNFRWMNVLFDYKDDAEIQHLIETGKRATWPKLERIRNSTIISTTLDNILVDLDEEELDIPGGKDRRRITFAA